VPQYISVVYSKINATARHFFYEDLVTNQKTKATQYQSS